MSCNSFEYAMVFAVVLCGVAAAGLAANVWLEVLDQIKRRKSARCGVPFRATAPTNMTSSADVIRYLQHLNEQTVKALNERRDQHG